MLSWTRTGIARWSAAACAGLALVAWAAPVQARRLALVVGNGQYVNTDPLTNPERDVDAISDRLRALHFEVAESKDVSGDGLRSQITAFKRTVSDGDTVVVYYAGHGMEVSGRDYILPVNADIQSVGDVPDWGYPLDGLFFTDKRNVSVIVVFDACRDNTFLRRTHANIAGASVINVPPGDMVIFSAGSGEVALDGDPGVAQVGAGPQNSVFANALLSAMAAPNLDDRDLFVEVRRQVQAHSNQQQNPQIIGALNQKFVFNAEAGAPGAGPAVSAYAEQSAPPPAIPAPPPAPLPAPAPVEVAAASPAPGAPIYRSVPVPAAAPPAMPAAPAPSPPVEVASAPPPAAAPPAPVPVAAALAQPTPPAAAPMQVAALGLPATPVSSGYGSNAAETAIPRQAGVYTIASLGMNRMPPRPELTPVPPVNIPASFCSAQERNSFHDQTYKPAWQIASINNDLAIKYLDALNALHREYAEQQSGYVNQITREYNDYVPIAAEAFNTSNRYTNMHDAIMAVPVGACK